MRETSEEVAENEKSLRSEESTEHSHVCELNTLDKRNRFITPPRSITTSHIDCLSLNVSAETDQVKLTGNESTNCGK